MKGSNSFRQLSGQWRTLLFTVNKIRKTCLQVATSQKNIEKTLLFFFNIFFRFRYGIFGFSIQHHRLRKNESNEKLIFGP